MKVCLACWAPFYAGAEVAAKRLAEGLQSAGHDVLMVLGTDGETLEQMHSAGLRCEIVPLATTDKWRWWKYADARRQLASLFRREQPDIVHANDLPSSQMVGQAAKRLGIPRLCHHRFPFGATAINWLNKFGAERHVFISQALSTEMCGASNVLAKAPRAVVHDGIPLPSIPTTADRKLARKRLGFNSDKVLVLFAGQIVQHKGVADLINAWQLLSETFRRRVEILIIGEDLQKQGEYRRAMESLAKEIGCPARFLGFQRNMAEWQTAADIAVVPSHVEPLGLVVMEAMAHALPVVGSDVGGIPEMIVDGETGLLVSPRDPQSLAGALERLINSPEERRRLGEAGRRRCEMHFSIESHVKKMLEQYRLAMAALQSPAFA